MDELVLTNKMRLGYTRGAFYWEDRTLWVDPYKLIWRPLMFRLDAETAAHLTIQMLQILPAWLIIIVNEPRKVFP